MNIEVWTLNFMICTINDYELRELHESLYFELWTLWYVPLTTTNFTNDIIIATINLSTCKGGKTKCVNTIVGLTWLCCLYIRELPNIREWTERKTKCYKRVTFALHSMSVWTVFERIMLHRRENGAIWDVLSLNMCT